MDTTKVGGRIRAYRERKNMSLEEFCQRTGTSVEFLAGVESGAIAPPLGPLVKIARALGQRLGTFLDDQITADPHIVRAGERQQQAMTITPAGEKAAYDYYSLGQGKSDRHMEPFFIVIDPSSEEETQLSGHEGEEFIVVISGRLRVVYGKQDQILEPGDSVYFNSVVPHLVCSAGGEKTEIFAVIYVPE